MEETSAAASEVRREDAGVSPMSDKGCGVDPSRDLSSDGKYELFRFFSKPNRFYESRLGLLLIPKMCLILAVGHRAPRVIRRFRPLKRRQPARIHLNWRVWVSRAEITSLDFSC